MRPLAGPIAPSPPLPPPLRRRRRLQVVACGNPSASCPPPTPFLRAPSKEGASLRAEAEAPFRSFRLFIFGAGAAGAGLATLFGLPQLIGALGGAAGATKSVAEALQDFGINVGSFAALAFLVQRDLQVGLEAACPAMRWARPSARQLYNWSAICCGWSSVTPLQQAASHEATAAAPGCPRPLPPRHVRSRWRGCCGRTSWAPASWSLPTRKCCAWRSSGADCGRKGGAAVQGRQLLHSGWLGRGAGLSCCRQARSGAVPGGTSQRAGAAAPAELPCCVAPCCPCRRGFARAVLIAGTPAQVAAGLAAAEPYKQQLQERGVLVVPLPFVTPPGGGGGAEAEAAAAAALAPPGPEDLRWRATPIRLGEWQAWFQKQAAMAGKGLGEGLYISLRLDGRVRGSGVGTPPW